MAVVSQSECFSRESLHCRCKPVRHELPWECSLIYYTTHREEYFKEDNTTFRFGPGNHKLEKSTRVFMSNVSNLLLYGSDVDEVTVECRGQDSGGFMFYNVTNLTI